MADCKHASARPSPVAGRGLFADKDIGEGEIIFSIPRPIAHALEDKRLNDTCDNCFAWSGLQHVLRGHDAPPLTAKACTGCRKVRYCSKTCQSQAWKRLHKHECQTIAQKWDDSKDCSVRLVERLRLMVTKSLLNKDDSEAVNALKANDYESDEGTGGIDEVTRAVQNKVRTNALTLCACSFDPLGAALDPLTSMANHSCEENAYVAFDGPRLTMRSVVPIKKNEEIYVSYIKNHNPFRVRQMELKDRYMFTCACKKCKLGPATWEDKLLRPASYMDSLPDIKLLEKNLIWSLWERPSLYVGPSRAEKRLSAIQGALFNRLEIGRRCKDHGQAIQEFGAAVAYARRTKVWPMVRAPIPECLEELVVRLHRVGSIDYAWKMRAYINSELDPQMHPVEFSPSRVMHTFIFVNMSLQYYDMRDHSGLKAILETGFDFVKVVWHLLRKLVVLVAKSHGPGQLSIAIQRRFAEVNGEVERAGLSDPRWIEQGMDEQWELLRFFAKGGQ